MSIVLTTIKTEEKFEALWERINIFGGVLQTEHQLLTNREVYSVLTVREKYLLVFPVIFTRPSFILYFPFDDF